MMREICSSTERELREKRKMNKIFNAASVCIGIAGGVAAKMLGACDAALCALACVMALDYATGVIKAAYTKKVSSAVGYKGILKKTVILVIVALANVIQTLTGTNAALREMVIMFYIANESISILENASEIYPDMPPKIKDILLQIRGGEDDNRN